MVLGWVLLHFVWQGTAIALALAVLLTLTSTAQATLRYALSCGALTLMLVVVAATAANVMTGNTSHPQRLGLPAEANAPGLPSLPTTDGDALEKDGSVRLSTGAVETSLTARIPPARGLSSLARPIIEPAMPWLVLGWAIGVMVLCLRLVGGWWRTRALRVEGVSAVPAWCRAQLTGLSSQLRITRPVSIVASVRVSVPVVLGHLKPVVILPAAVLAGLSPTQLEAILAHELAHVRRHDYLVNLAQSVIETLLFYHPAVWWVSRQVRVAREHCCDDLAVTVCGSRTAYVHALLGLEELRQPDTLLALGATTGSLLGRARRLLVPAEHCAASPRLAASVIALTVVALAAAGVPFASGEAAWVDPSAGQTTSRDTTTSGAGERRVPPTNESVQQEPAAPVVMSPDATGTLASRWTWAERSARAAQRSRYWVGYTVSPVKTLPPFVYIDRSGTLRRDRMTFSGHILTSDVSGLRFPGRPLALPLSEKGTLKLLFGFDTAGRAVRLTAVHISTPSLPVDTKDLPVFWLGPADAVQSLEHVDALYQRASMLDLKDDLIAAAGVHDASSAVVAWLERRVAGRDPDTLRGDATEWIAWHPIAASVTALDRIARTDRASHVRQEAAEALGDLALPEAATVLIALARTLQDPDARREAVEALGARQELEARDALGSIARHDASLDIQREAVETLGDFEDQRGVGLLIELARAHPVLEVRREAIETLGDALPNETLIPLLEDLARTDPDPGVQEEAVDTLAELEHPNGLAAVIALAQSHPRTSVRREAVEALAQRASEHGGGRGGDIVDVLSKLAGNDPEIEVQLEAVETLGEILGAAAVERLRELAGTHRDERIRIEAIEALSGTLPAVETARTLKSIALAEKSTRVQDEAIEALGKLPEGAGIDALVDIAREHPAASARNQALETLLESDHPRARDIFHKVLQKPGR
jgi:beta-lactamase regulating signal transducer with metallopeptidase domain/HEAT repeat protein